MILLLWTLSASKFERLIWAVVNFYIKEILLFNDLLFYCFINMMLNVNVLVYVWEFFFAGPHSQVIIFKAKVMVPREQFDI